MHVFIVISVPEQKGMIPRTYGTLATLGQQAHMDGQAAYELGLAYTLPMDHNATREELARALRSDVAALAHRAPR